jgi:hypothetical protein
MPNATGIIRNKAHYGYQGWDAEMVYALQASEVAAFIASNYLDEYAAANQMAVVDIIDEPWMDGGDVLDPATGISQSRRVTVRFAIVYLDVPWPMAITRPAYAGGTTLKLHATYSGQLLPLAPRAHRPAAGPVAGPNTQFSVYVALNEFHVEWGRVTDLASLDFSDLIGAVNSDTFMGVPAGQLLCAGVTLTPSFVLTPGEPCAWTVVVTVKQKSQTDSTGTYGWNDWYNPATQQWEEFTLTSGDPPYDTTAFSGMFS